jgi:autotransporter-associated beta strand protein
VTLVDHVDVTVAAANDNLNLTAALDNAAARTINKNGAGTMTISGAQAHAAGAVLNVNAGTLALLSNAGASSTANVTLNANAGTTRVSSRQNLNALNVASPALVTVTQGGARTMKTRLLSMAGDGKLDLGDNNLVVDYTGVSPLGVANASGVYTGVTRLLQTGRGTGGAWTGPGIHSTRAAATGGLTALAVAEASRVLGLSGTQTATWSGQPVDATSVLVKYTYAGDANLDGQIDAGDYGVIDNFVQIAGAFGWANGDFNLDGFIDAGDYGIIDSNVQAQGAAFPAAAGSSPLTAVPEPALAAPALFALVARRRRRRARSPR